jgi:two-component sensor histidine kinase
MRGMQINWKSLKADIGGRWFLYRKSLIPLAPFLTLTSVLSSSINQAGAGQFEQDVALRYLLLVAANVASILVCWLFIELASITVFRSRSVTPVNWIVVLAFGASVGFLKGSSTGAFSFLFGSENNLEEAVSNRIVQTSLLGLWMFPVLALFSATYFRYQSERAALIAERIRFAATPVSNGVIPDHQVALRAFIAESKAKISELQTLSPGSTDPGAIARILRKLIEEGLRPISHQIWMTEQNSRSGFRLRDLTILALRKNPFPLTFVGLSLLIGLLPLNLVSNPTAEALTLTFVTIALILGIYGLFLLLNKILSVHPVLLFLIGNVAACTLGFWLTAVIFGDEITEESLILMGSLLLWLLQITLYASVITEVLTSRSEVRAELSKLTGRADINADAAIAANRFASRELAQHVHSNIQNQLLARALTLDNENLTDAEIELQLSEVQVLLDRALEMNQVANQESMLANLEEIVARWRGFVRIDLDVEIDQGSIEPLISQSISLVVSEAISNSVRHGLAQTVSIRIAKPVSNEPIIEVKVIDDGLGPRSGPIGLGTELFTSVTGGNWEIKSRAAGGTELSLRIPLSVG